MLGIATILVASSLTAVGIPADVQRRVYSTYPNWAVQQGHSAATAIEAVVEPDGEIRECRVVAFFGSERLANEECSRLLRHKLRPAVDVNGQPILGLHRNLLKRWLSGAEAEAVESWMPEPDLTAELSDLAIQDGGVDVAVVVLVNANGSVAVCDADPDRNKNIAKSITDAACAEAAERVMPVLQDKNGQASDYVANMTVRLEAVSSAST